MTMPRRFHLQRATDVTGVSGTGHVADGVLWADGTASVRWLGEHPSIVFWDRGQASVELIHGHGGHTAIVWDEDQGAARLARIGQAHVKHVDGHGGTDGYCVECDETWPCPTYAWATTDRNPDATWDPADDEPQEPEQPTVPCSLANLSRPHIAHSWQPQPGMRPVLCAGIPAPGSAR